MTNHRNRFGLFTLSVLAAMLAGSCGVSDERPNVIVAVFDACRTDKLGAYGFERPTTPELDRLAADPDAVVFERHYVTADWTKPSTASLFTGLFVSQHRVALGHEPAQNDEQAAWSQALPAELQTMAESFRAAGYSTFGLVRIPHLHEKYGFSQGFDRYVYLGDDAEVATAALAFAEEAEPPFFAYLHFLGCHNPYLPGERDPEYLAEFGFPYDEQARQAAGIDFTDPSLHERMYEGGLEPDPDDLRFLHLVYEAKVRSMDRQLVGPFLDGLRERGLYDDTLLVVSADHGDELYEHGTFTHAQGLWQEVAHVPLIVKFADGARPPEFGPRWGRLTSAVDLYPSLLAHAGVEPEKYLPGFEFLETPVERIALAEKDDDDWVAIRGRYKLLRRPDGSVLLFDLEQDPHEQHDLVGSRPKVVADMIRAVVALRKNHPSPLAGDLDEEISGPSEEELDALRSLGYVR